MKPTGIASCDVCEKPTSRMMGFFAVLKVTDEGGEVFTRVRTSVRGFCLKHKPEIAPRFMADAEAEGEILWCAPEPALLRPNEISRFERDIDAMTNLVGEAHGLNEPDTHRTSFFTGESGGDLPTTCPHCQARLSWGTGPHVKDAEARNGRAFAWECTGCRAAGMLTLG